MHSHLTTSGFTYLKSRQCYRREFGGGYDLVYPFTTKRGMPYLSFGVHFRALTSVLPRNRNEPHVTQNTLNLVSPLLPHYSIEVINEFVFEFFTHSHDLHAVRIQLLKDDKKYGVGFRSYYTVFAIDLVLNRPDLLEQDVAHFLQRSQQWVAFERELCRDAIQRLTTRGSLA